MNHLNVLELALRDPSRLAADLSGRPRHTVNEPPTVPAHVARRLVPGRRPHREH